MILLCAFDHFLACMESAQHKLIVIIVIKLIIIISASETLTTHLLEIKRNIFSASGLFYCLKSPFLILKNNIEIKCSYNVTNHAVDVL